MSNKEVCLWGYERFDGVMMTTDVHVIPGEERRCGLLSRLPSLLVGVSLLLFAMPFRSFAQSDPEYLMEVGAGVGVVNYMGDFNANLTKNFQPGAAILLRRLLSPYMGFKFDVMYGKLKGSSKDMKTYYHDYVETPYEFSNTLIDGSVTYEYNFWPYGTGRDYRGAQRLTPYIFGGLGGTFVTGGGKNVFTANVPLGIGVKYKIGDRLNFGAEWAVHFSLSDEPDGVKDPYYVKSTGAFKNTDCYTALMLSLTYSFMAKCRTCHNEDE